MCSPLLCHVTCKAMTFRPTSVVILLFYHLTIGKLSCPPELKLFSKLPPPPPPTTTKSLPNYLFSLWFSAVRQSKTDDPKMPFSHHNHSVIAFLFEKHSGVSPEICKISDSSTGRWLCSWSFRFNPVCSAPYAVFSKAWCITGQRKPLL